MAFEHRLLRASAGTGKTYQLTEAYAQLITEGGLRPHQIVAITFTRKAATELKLRIRARLREAALPDAMLTELGRAPVANFHGLALALLRQLGAQAGYSPSTGILGDGDDARLFAQACESAWLTDPASTAQPAMAEQGDLFCAISAAVSQVSQHMDVAFALPEALWEALGRAREDGRTPDASLLGSYDAQAAQSQAHAQLLALRARLAAGIDTQTAKSRDKVQDFLRASAAIDAVDAASWSAAWGTALSCLDRRGKLGQLFTAEDKSASEAALTLPGAEAACAALVGPLGLLLEQAWKRYEEAKLAAHVMDFGDIIARIVGAMQSDAGLHASATHGIRAVLVDEAQDTNRQQRDMIRLLAGLTGPAARPEQPAQLIVVGDRKQCIYTFRGADPQSFDLFAADIAALGGAQTQLSISRRSRPHLVAGINHLGAYMFGPDVYEPLDALPRNGDQPCGGMHWVPLLPGVPDALEAPSDAVTHEAQSIATLIREAIDDGAQAADFAVLLATMTHAPLLARVFAAAGIPAVVGGGGGLLAQPEVQDILALLAWLCDPGARLEAAVALRSPLVGLSDGAITQLLHRPGLAAPQAQSEMGTQQPQTMPSGERSDALMALAFGHLPALDAAGLTPDDQDTLAMLAAWLPGARRAAETMAAADCLQFCDQHLHMRALVRGAVRGAQKLANVQRLCDLAARFDDTQSPSVQAFVRAQQDRLARGYDDPITPVNDVAQAAVRVCSVHQSKGLQFPRVVLAFLNRRGRSTTGCMRYDRDAGLAFAPRAVGSTTAHHTARWRTCAEAQNAVQDAEQRRLLYVAVTRAEEHVYFVGPPTASGALAGFGRYLLPWRQAALAQGVLREQPLRRTWQDVIDKAAQPPGAPKRDAAPDLILLRTTPPPGAALETTVTALAQAVIGASVGTAMDEPVLGRQAHKSAVHGGQPSGETELEPRLRGHLVHRVLSAVAHLDAHPDAEHFVTAQLEIAGFAPTMSAVAGLHADLVAFLTSAAARPMLKVPTEHRRHELPFVLRVPHPTYQLTLRGQLDLVYWDNEGPVIVDYKHAHEDAATREAYFFQLDAYAVAVSQMCQIEGPIRTQLVYLRDRQSPHQHLATDARRRAVETAMHHWANNNA